MSIAVENFIKYITFRINGWEKKDLLGMIGDMDRTEIDELCEEIKKLVHHKDTTVGLFAIDHEPQTILHSFFNHKSDANKYLDATEQDDLEADFGNWLLETMFKINF